MFKSINRSALVAALAMSAAAAQAAVPAGVEAIFTGVATDFGVVLGYGYVAMGVIVGGGIVLGLVKSVAKKSTTT